MRKEAGLSLRDLADKVGMPHETIHKIEKGRLKRGPRLDTLMDITIKGELDRHKMAHYAFDLPEPEGLGEIDGDKKELCDLVLSLDEVAVGKILGFAYGLIEGGGEEEQARDGPG